MLYKSETKDYPNLVQVLRERLRSENTLLSSWAGGTAVLFVLGLIALPIALEANLFLGLGVLAALGIGAWRVSVSLRSSWKDLQVKMDRLKVMRAMLACLEHNRLEHDVSHANATVLEACAENYLRSESTLRAWNLGGASDLRSRLKDGIEDAMTEAILIHRDALPDNPSALPIGQQVGKLANKLLFGGYEEPTAPVEPAFSRTRDLAEQLQSASSEIERAAREITGAVRPAIPSSNLDSALRDLKMVREAEEELRQDLHGGA